LVLYRGEKDRHDRFASLELGGTTGLHQYPVEEEVDLIAINSEKSPMKVSGENIQNPLETL
jgi:hypothetical protein